MNNTTEEYLNKLTEEDARGLLSALNDTALVSMTDVKGDIIYANDKFVEVSKYSREELIGQNHRILKSGHQPQEIFNELWLKISKGNVWRGEIKNRAKDKTYYWVDTSIAPILSDDGKPERYISVRFVITDKKELEESLRAKITDLEKFNKLMVGRELKMAELKEELKALKEKK